MCPVAVVGGGSGGIGDKMSAGDKVSAWLWCSQSPCDSIGGGSSSALAVGSGSKSLGWLQRPHIGMAGVSKIIVIGLYLDIGPRAG